MPPGATAFPEHAQGVSAAPLGQVRYHGDRVREVDLRQSQGRDVAIGGDAPYAELARAERRPLVDHVGDVGDVHPLRLDPFEERPQHASVAASEVEPRAYVGPRAPGGFEAAVDQRDHVRGASLVPGDGLRRGRLEHEVVEVHATAQGRHLARRHDAPHRHARLACRAVDVRAPLGEVEDRVGDDLRPHRARRSYATQRSSRSRRHLGTLRVTP